MRYIDLVVIHCAATPNGRPVSIEEIDRWHAARGFRRNPALIGYNAPQLKHIGYHYVIYTAGAVAAGRGLEEAGAHAAGFNYRSIGICMNGTDAFTVEQWTALRDCVCATIATIAQRRNLPEAPRYRHAPAESLALAARMKLRICGHRDLSPDTDGDGEVEQYEWLKTCPGFNVSDWLAGGMQPLEGHIFRRPGAKPA